MYLTLIKEAIKATEKALRSTYNSYCGYTDMSYLKDLADIINGFGTYEKLTNNRWIAYEAYSDYRISEDEQDILIRAEFEIHHNNGQHCEAIDMALAELQEQLEEQLKTENCETTTINNGYETATIYRWNNNTVAFRDIF